MLLQGKGVSPGIAIGKLVFLPRDTKAVEKRQVEDVKEEVSRFESARALAAAQLGELAVSTAEKLGQQNSLLFEIHQMMLEDLDYTESVTGIITTQHVCAEYAVQQTAQQFAQAFADMDDEYMRERAADVRDVSQRVIQILTGRGAQQAQMQQPGILASDDFSPSETAQFSRDRVLGLATMSGAATSHTAIFARTMGIPAVIGLGEALTEELGGKTIVLDGEAGVLLIDPDEATLQAYTQKQQEYNKQKQGLQAYKDKKTISPTGQQVKLFANIGSPADMDAVLKNGAEGVGLFRTEFLYLERSDYPSEEQQFAAYSQVAQKLQDRPLIIRTLDIGADKQAAYFNLPQEENPAMGMRALRICLTRPQVFKTQLRAIYRAAVQGNISIMLPMVTSVEEVRRAKEIAAEAREELAQRGEPFNKDVPMGIMIETPAAAIISDLLAKEVDFFSLGTNDLTQYTLAVDRQNQELEEFCNTHHTAVLRLIEMSAQNAHQNGIWIGICGELAADPALTATFLKMGIDELSMSPSAILPLRRQICEGE